MELDQGFMTRSRVRLIRQTEVAVNAAISVMGITRIVIAQREETISAANRVVEMRDGVLGYPAAIGAPAEVDPAT